MKLLALSLRGVTAYTDRATVDFGELPDGLVAIVGPNGSGKTTLLEAAMAALDKQLPTRPGSLYDRCHGRDAYIEATFLDGSDVLTARVLVDAERRTTEGYIFRTEPSCGTLPLTDGKAAAFAEIVPRLFGSRTLRLASVFAAQDKTGDFLRAPRAARKELFAELLDTASLEAIAERAREHVARITADLDAARRDVERLTAEAAGLAEAEASLTTAEAVVVRSREALDDARMAEADLADRLASARRGQHGVAQLHELVEAASKRVGEAEDALARNEREAVRARENAAERRRALERRNIDAEERGLREGHEQAEAESLGRAAEIAETLTTLGDQAELAFDLEAVRADLKAARRELENIAAYDGRIATAQERVRAEGRALMKAREDAAAKRSELKQRAGLLGRVPCTAAETWAAPDGCGEPKRLAATCPLLADARASSVESVTDPTTNALDAERAKVAALQNERNALTAPDLAPLESRERELQQAHAAAAQRPALEAEAKRIAASSADAERRFRAVLAALNAERATVATELASVDAGLRSDLERLKEEHIALQERHDGTATEHADAQRRLAEALERAAGVEAIEREHREATEAADTIQRALTVATANEAAARERATTLRRRAEELQAARTAADGHTTELGDWRLIADGLGKQGVQALEIDAAAPEVSELVNELLRSCYGPRFSVTFETLREKRSAPGEYTEVFDVRVYDGAVARPVEDLSGGERVIVSEAVRQAIATYNARKSAVRWETLWLDETAGALDPKNAQSYVRMLRRARELSGARQVIFVAHQQEVWEQADAVIRIEAGRVIQAGATCSDTSPTVSA